VIEDEPQMRLGLHDNLKLEGYEVTTAATAEEGILKARGEAPDLILLDLMLPGKTGFDVCREVRARGSTVPIIILTARGQDFDKVLGFDLGADDYITKPFSLVELLARVRSALRRTEGRPASIDACRIGDIDFDFRTQQARRGEQRLEFTSLEFDLLRFLVAHKGEAITRDEILAHVWGREAPRMTRTVDNFVARLRQKIEKSPREPEHILTVHGSGYKFVG
jgi:two-component system alkaline phosphatase synthesis response regulator PhoP